MVMIRCDPEYAPHLLLHHFFLLIERVVGTRLIEFGPPDRGHRYDRKVLEFAPGSISVLGPRSEDHYPRIQHHIKVAKVFPSKFPKLRMYIPTWGEYIPPVSWIG